MKPDPLVDDDGPPMTTCCPECGSTTIFLRTGGRGDEDVPPGTYRCEDCGERFSEPEFRPKEVDHPANVGGLPPAAKALIEMDPDDWPPKDQELVTDGGEDPVDVIMHLCRFFHLKEVGNLAKARDVDGEFATAIFEIQAAAYGHAAEECWRTAQYLRGEVNLPDAVWIGREKESDRFEDDQELVTDGGEEPDESPERRFDDLAGTWSLDADWLAGEHFVDDGVSVEITVGNGSALLSVTYIEDDRDVGVLAKLPPELSRRAGESLIEIADVVEARQELADD